MNVLILLALSIAVIVVFMVRGLTTNIIGFLVLNIANYFEIGHRIEIQGIIGDVIGVNLINFKILGLRTGLSADARQAELSNFQIVLFLMKPSRLLVGKMNQFGEKWRKGRIIRSKFLAKNRLPFYWIGGL